MANPDNRIGADDGKKHKGLVGKFEHGVGARLSRVNVFKVDDFGDNDEDNGEKADEQDEVIRQGFFAIPFQVREDKTESKEERE